MNRLRQSILAALVAFSLVSIPALAWIRSPATTFATLPAGATPPEGITADGAGNIYVTTFGFPASGATTAPGQLIVFDHSGRVIRQMAIVGASPHLLGLAFNPTTSDLLVLDFGAAKVLKVNPHDGQSTVFSDIGSGAGLNGLTFDSSGNVYISDSSGKIWKTGPSGGVATAWLTDPLLTTTGKPPFRSTFADNAKPLTTILLVARADMPDLNFKDSIVLVMNDIGPSPAGVIINRPTRIPVSRVFPEFESLAQLDDKVYFGGPVEIQSVSFLFRVDKAPEQTAIEVLDGVYFSADRELLRQLLSRDKPMEGLRIFVGFSGWGRGQLESEIARGDWTLEPANATAIFAPKSQHPWPERQPSGAGRGA